jgi:hypothetical protein
MSLADFSERDLDLLADHLAGVLDAPAAAQVERLIRTDPVWAAAFAELRDIDSAVRVELRATGQAPQPMPADVVARLDAALAAEATGRGAGLAPVVPIDKARSGRHAAGSGSRGRRRGRRFGGWAAAAVLLVAVGTGVVLSLPNSPLHTSTNAAGGADSASAPRQAVPAPATSKATGASGGGYALLASGTNYTPTSLAAAARSGRSADLNSNQPSGAGEGATPAPSAPPVPGSAPTPGTPNALHDQSAPYALGLGRLADPVALQMCIAQVTYVHPGVVVSVDYARYEATPAVIVVVHQTNGAIAVAAGANCGLGSADEIATAAA